MNVEMLENGCGLSLLTTVECMSATLFSDSS